MKFTKTDYTNNKEILAFASGFNTSMAAMIDDADGVADASGKKIIPAGTFVGGASASVFADKSQLLRVVHDYAILETAMTGDNNDIKLVAVADGPTGADVTLTLVDPAANSASLVVSVTGKDISASLATGAEGAITTTASELIAAINASAAASALVTASLKGTDTGAVAVTALAKTSLANSAVSGASVIDGVLLNDVDVTYGDNVCSLLVSGYLKTSKLPVAPTTVMRTAFSKNLFLGFIEN